MAFLAASLVAFLEACLAVVVVAAAAGAVVVVLVVSV